MVRTTNSSIATSRHLGFTGQRDRLYRTAFTIPEMLAVIAVIVIVISILLPALGKGREAAWIAQCASNQHQIRIAIHGNKMTDGFSSLPGAGRWVFIASNRNATEILQCPAGSAFSDTEDAASQQFDQLYSVQVSGSTGTTISYITDIMAGQLATDPQLGRQWHGEFIGDFGEHGTGWIAIAWGQPLDPEDHMGVSYNDDGGFLVEFEGTNDATVHSLDAPGDTSCGSDHWVCIGEGGADWQGEIIMRLTGNGHQNQVDPPVKVGSGSAHYGMNNLATDTDHRAGQILLMDYGKTIIRMNTNGSYLDDFDTFFAPRHFNKANVMRVDGSVTLMSRGELNNNDAWKGNNN